VGGGRRRNVVPSESRFWLKARKRATGDQDGRGMRKETAVEWKEVIEEAEKEGNGSGEMSSAERESLMERPKMEACRVARHTG
jgi:hypothetical protein